ncbi:response regulator transcription factor [Paenibacillus sp. DMB20]|uniref:response regulator transcription factor n=1 Tax=Paenibacillus sp. DMB20 TaxID=1642570 RepID=UPI000628022F|nr:response regulator transcription factor [Paenibacillus sp. DMB20]KKO50785.1 PhoP family transcriptional regulator [Paenibacillus sp. DMB20]
MTASILLVEDDLSIGEMVENYLSGEGFEICRAKDGEEALHLFNSRSFDLVLLDLMLPKLGGMDFLRIVRERSHVPILILSAKDGEADKALGLGFGADDYIAKPFSMIELTARVKAAIRRATFYADVNPPAQDSRIVKVHELSMDLDNLTVSKNGREIKLTAKELELLKLFLTHPKKVFTKQQIYSSVWKDEYYGDENVINVHMSRLREKIEDEPSVPQYIKTLWGIGYRLGEF